jgi:hypothetical protein
MPARPSPRSHGLKRAVSSLQFRCWNGLARPSTPTSSWNWHLTWPELPAAATVTHAFESADERTLACGLAEVHTPNRCSAPSSNRHVGEAQLRRETHQAAVVVWAHSTTSLPGGSIRMNLIRPLSARARAAPARLAMASFNTTGRARTTAIGHKSAGASICAASR